MKFYAVYLGDFYSKKSDSSPEINIKTSGISYNDPSHSNKNDDEFGEVLPGDLESSIGFNKNNPNDSLEYSKKSLTGSNMVSVSMGYDNSVTNYKLDEFDYVEDVNPINF
jgi:hypothetical protein